jgi:ribonuclease-3 family protein
MEVDKSALNGSRAFALLENWEKAEVLRLPARTLAYIGDGVYELALRLHQVSTGIDDAGKLHDSLFYLASSPAQARVFELVFETLPEEERDFVKTWRNAKIPLRYGSGTRGEYARATALEAFVGYLFVTGQQKRLDEVIELALGLKPKE